MKRIKFTGRFRDLIPMGLRFQKLFARNYRCYHNLPTYEPGEKRDPKELHVSIWQKDRSFEIEDWNGFEVPIIEYLQAHPFKPYKSKHKIIGIINWVTLLCDKKTFKVRKKKPGDDPVWFYARAEKGEITEKEAHRLAKEHYAAYREIIVEPAQLFALLKRFEGMYEII